MHLGLGNATQLSKLTVRWPSGFLQEIGPVADVDRVITIDPEKGVLPAPVKP
jgi:hypothetical protein